METKNKYQIIDEKLRAFLEWRSKCGHAGWYNMDDENIKKFIESIVNSTIKYLPPFNQ